MHSPAPIDSRPTGGGHTVVDNLRDFTTSPRILILSAMALVIGSAGAFSAWILLHLIYLFTNIAYFGRFSADYVTLGGHSLGLLSVFIPVVGSLVIGLMARFGSEKIRGHGIPEAMEAILIGRSDLDVKVAVLKPISSAVSIGTGGPFGAEGPIIMTGGAFGSLFAQFFKMSNAERKTLLVAGAAAGMAATFGTPVAAILLAVELLLFEWKPRSFVPVAIASIVAAAWRPYLIGSGALFPMPASGDIPDIALLFAAILGIICGLASGLLTQMVYAAEDLFLRLPIHWMWWPVMGGVVVGFGGLINPHALGVGYDNIEALLQGHVALLAIVSLVVVKAVIWSIALGSGTSGGVLAPLLMMGGAVGALFGHVMPVGTVGFWALIGMAAIMGGTMRSPLTAIVFALELTHNIDALLPLAVAATVAHTTTVLLLRRSILTEKVARRGYHVMREYIVDPFETMRVSEVMASPVETLPADMPIKDVVRFFHDAALERRHKSYPVVDANNHPIGIVARSDALRWTMEQSSGDHSLGDMVASRHLITGYDDELIGQLVDRMIEADVGRVPILHRSDDKLIGLVARRDLLRVRAHLTRHEREREALLRFGPNPGSALG